MQISEDIMENVGTMSRVITIWAETNLESSPFSSAGRATDL